MKANNLNFFVGGRMRKLGIRYNPCYPRHPRSKALALMLPRLQHVAFGRAYGVKVLYFPFNQFANSE